MGVASMAQWDAEALPKFYDATDGDKILNCDMESDGMDPVVIYNTYNKDETLVKTWNGKKWIQYLGDFPKIKHRGFVNLEFHNGDAYALVQDGEYFSLYRLKADDEVWKLYGTKNFATNEQLATPKLVFLNDNPIIYERHHSKAILILFKYEDGEFRDISPASEFKGINDDFQIISTDSYTMYWSWTSTNSPDFYFFEVPIIEGYATRPSMLTNGIKAKEVKAIKKLFYINKTLYLVYSNVEWNYELYKLADGASKWEQVRQPEVLNSPVISEAEDLSIVVQDKASKLPIFCHFNGSNWDAGFPLGLTPMLAEKPSALAKCLDEYFYLFEDNHENTIVMKFKNN